MTYPVDQLVALAKANGHLALRLADIMRTTGEEFLSTSNKARSSALDHLKDSKLGAFPVLNGDSTSSAWREMEKSREEALAQTRAAFSEWQDKYRELLVRRQHQWHRFEVVI